MARTPRTGRGGAGSFRGNTFGGTLGSLLRTALVQVGNMRDVVEREARATRSRIDGALGDRRRHDALARLGEAVLELWERGDLGDLADVPEVTECFAEIEAIDAHSEADAARPRRAAGRGGRGASVRNRGARDDDEPNQDDGTVASVNWAASRARFDRGRVKPTAQASAPRQRPGGIAFVPDDRDDDQELSEYMHEDDVPPKAK